MTKIGFPDDFLINIADFAKVEGKHIPTEQQIEEEYCIAENELT